MLGGVAAGLADHLGVTVLPVRVALVVLLLFNGLGALLYVVFWAFLPSADEPDRPHQGRVPTLLLFGGLAMLVIGARVVILGGEAASALGWLFALIALGAGIIWHQTVAAGRPGATGVGLIGMLTGPGRAAFLLRFVGGGVLILVGIAGLLAVVAPLTGGGLAAVLNGLLFTLIAMVGIGLMTAPLLWRMFGALREEREARIREQERAEFAAMVHDQVLHTLALIQRHTATGSTAYRLARAQERTLRNWLYKPTGSPHEQFAAAVEQAAGEVEDAYGITVEVVVVGDADTDERFQALVAAAREAMVNAARHAGVDSVSLYAEVEPDQVNLFVRDRGVGFDLATVNGDRHGVRGSIIGRMERHGGQAEIISAPGEGTEVRLRLPLSNDRHPTDHHSAPSTRMEGHDRDG
jgi:signal transduction histidine kinase/phage shock protein PspC (stress-responsive transcriptional regulator)